MTDTEPNPAAAFAAQLASVLGEPWYIEDDSARTTPVHATSHVRYSCTLVDEPDTGDVSERGLEVSMTTMSPGSVSVLGFGIKPESPSATWRTDDVEGMASLVRDLILPVCRPTWDRQIAGERETARAKAESTAWLDGLREQIAAFGQPRPDDEDDETLVMPLYLDNETVHFAIDPKGSVTIHAEELGKTFATRAAHALATLITAQ